MKKKKSQKQIEIEKSYKKERKRIQQFLRRTKARGYVYLIEVLPKIPKKITESSIKKLKKITSAQIYKKAKYSKKETGELISGLKGKEQEKIERKKYKESPSVYTKDIIEEIKNAINEIPDEVTYKGGVTTDYSEKKARINELLDEMVAESKKDGSYYAYIEYLNQNFIIIDSYAQHSMYESDQEIAEAAFYRIPGVIKGGPLTIDESKFYEDLSEEVIL